MHAFVCSISEQVEEMLSLLGKSQLLVFGECLGLAWSGLKKGIAQQSSIVNVATEAKSTHMCERSYVFNQKS